MNEVDLVPLACEDGAEVPKHSLVKYEMSSSFLRFGYFAIFQELLSTCIPDSLVWNTTNKLKCKQDFS